MATKTKPDKTAAALEAKSVAVAAELEAAEDAARELKAALGAAMVAGDERAEAVQAELAAALAKVERLELGSEAFKAAVEAARERERAEHRAELANVINLGAASMATHIGKWSALVDQLEATSVEIATEAAAMIVADRELYPADWEHEDRRRRPQHPESLLKASLASAPRVRERGTAQKTAADAAAKLLAYAGLFVVEED
jgi:hypothetical protein